MLLTVIFVLLSATCKPASCFSSRGRNVPDGSNNATYLSAAYYVNWATYDRHFDPQDLPTNKLTHVLYAFANISSTTGEVSLSDTWADTEKHFAEDSSSEAGTNLYGCFKQLYLLKKANRHLKVLLSIGGSTYSANFSTSASTNSGRSTFASTAVSLVANLGLDGLDIDWEFPQDDTEAADMVLLLKSIRAALDAYGNSLSTPYHFQLTVACPTGPSNYKTLHLADMDQYVDFWFLMAYNYAGSWSSTTGNQANLFPSLSDPASTPFDTTEVISYYISKGIPAKKIVLGIPIYGHSFVATDGLGKPFNGTGSGTWEAGIYDFKAVPLAGATERYDSTTGSSYSYDVTRKQLISYDNVAVVKQKANYIQQTGLGGAMWWESSADKMGNESLIQTVADVLGRSNGFGLETSQNQLAYLNSTYDNLRAGMPGSDSVSTATPASTTCMPEAYSVPIPISSLDASYSSFPTTWDSETSSTSSDSAVQSDFIEYTIHSTRLATIASGASAEDDAPTNSRLFTTVTVPVSTTICPVMETSAESGEPSSVSASLSTQTATHSSNDTNQLPQSIISSLVVPGENGVPGCAYILADDMGAGAICSSDYCYCGGTVAPLLTSMLSGTLTINCNYRTQPVANSCPTRSISSSAVPSTAIPNPGSSSYITTYSSTSPSSVSSPAFSTFPTAGSGCKTGATCETYKLFTSPSGTCFCGLDANDTPTCFAEYSCRKSCTANSDCEAGEACLIKSCCPPKKDNCNLHNFAACHIYTGGSTCVPLAAGCPHS